MVKSLFLAALVSFVATGGAFAQANGSTGAPSRGGADPRDNSITSTGATVAHPGASQSAGTTSMDRGVQRQDNAIDSSICKGC